jgi:hypothetical protein
MTVSRFAVSFDEKLARRVRRAAGKTPLSTWLADAAAARLRSEGLRKVVHEWEVEHGDITADELDAARRRRKRWAR